MADIRTLPLDQIRIDGDTQPRASIDMFTVQEYADDMARGVEFPPIDVVFDGLAHWLWDGFHRYHSARKAGLDVIRVAVRNGTVEEARWLSFGANASHGKRRSNDDKRRAVEMAMRHPNAARLSNVQIADHIGVDEKTVRTTRKDMEATSEFPKSSTRTGRDGRTIDTSNIGKAKAAEPETQAIPFPEIADGVDESCDTPDDREQMHADSSTAVDTITQPTTDSQDAELESDVDEQAKQEPAADHKAAKPIPSTAPPAPDPKQPPTVKPPPTSPKIRTEAAEQEERQRRDDEARELWAADLLQIHTMLTQSVGKRTDAYLAWYTQPGAPGFTIALEARHIRECIEHLRRVLSITFSSEE